MTVRQTRPVGRVFFSPFLQLLLGTIVEFLILECRAVFCDNGWQLGGHSDNQVLSTDWYGTGRHNCIIETRWGSHTVPHEFYSPVQGCSTSQTHYEPKMESKQTQMGWGIGEWKKNGIRSLLSTRFHHLNFPFQLTKPNGFSTVVPEDLLNVDLSAFKSLVQSPAPSSIASPSCYSTGSNPSPDGSYDGDQVGFDFDADAWGCYSSGPTPLPSIDSLTVDTSFGQSVWWHQPH